MDFLQKRIRQQDLSRKEGESKDFQWVINYSNLNLLPPFGKMCLLNLHQLESFTRDNKIIKNIHTIYQITVGGIAHICLTVVSNHCGYTPRGVRGVKRPEIL